MKRNSICIVAVIPLLLGGCGGGDDSIAFSRPAADRPDLDRMKMGKGKISIPASETFNFTSFQSSQTGVGQGNCKAVGKDGATASAASDGEGTATAQFEMGYCFDNTTGVPLNGVVRVRLNIDQKASAKSPEPKDGRLFNSDMATGKSSLTFLIKDTTGLTLRSESMIAAALDKGPHDLSTRQDLAFDARFEPRRGYYLVLVGKADVTARAHQSSSLTLDVSKASFEISWKAAETQRDDSAESAKEKPAEKTTGSTKGTSTSGPAAGR